MHNFIETVAKVQGMGAAACYSCGFGETCEVGVQAFHRAQGLKYSDDRHDAFWLAHMLVLGILPEGYIYPKKDRPVRDLLRKRSFLVSALTN